MATGLENRAFSEAMLVDYPLDEAIVFIKRRFRPEAVFDRNELEEWAQANGFSKDE